MLFGDLFFVRWPGQPRMSRSRSALYFALLVVTALWWHRAVFTTGFPVGPDRQFWISLDVAVNRTLCGTPSSWSREHRAAAYLHDHPDALQTPLSTIVATEAGSLQAYCRTTEPILNNENSLMLLMRLGLLFDPDMSMHQLGVFLVSARILALFAFCYVLLECGASVLFCALVLQGGFEIIANAPFSSHFYSVYPFFFALLILSVAAHTFVLRQAVISKLLVHLPISVLFGLLTAFSSNMRTSHLPIYVALFALYIWAAYRLARKSSPDTPLLWRVGWIAGGLAGFAWGYQIFMLTMIRPLVPAGPASFENYASHAVAHPLVLSLALPENPLSSREGIKWDDSVGLILARRMVPDATYLGKTYEKALVLYYAKLWMLHPGEMERVYSSKFVLSGEQLLPRIYDDPSLGWLAQMLRPFRFLRHHVNTFWGFLLACAITAALYYRTGCRLWYAFLLLSVIALMMQIEMIVIMPYFYIQYHNYLLLYAILMGLLSYQLLLELTKLAAVWLFRRPRTETQ